MSGTQSGQSGSVSLVTSDRPWITHYPAGVPADLEIPQITLPEMLAQSSLQYADHIFATFFGRNYSYREIDHESTRFAN